MIIQGFMHYNFLSKIINLHLGHFTEQTGTKFFGTKFDMVAT